MAKHTMPIDDEDAELLQGLRTWFNARARAESAIGVERLEAVLAPTSTLDAAEIERLRAAIPPYAGRGRWWSRLLGVLSGGLGGRALIPVVVCGAVAGLVVAWWMTDDRRVTDSLQPPGSPLTVVDRTDWEIEVETAREFAGSEPGSKCLAIGPGAFLLRLRPHRRPRAGQHEARIFAASDTTRVQLFPDRTFRWNGDVLEIEGDADSDLPILPGRWTLLVQISSPGDDCDVHDPGARHCSKVAKCIDLHTDPAHVGGASNG